ncbi:MAG: DUF1540 domain-containing protein [Clostridiales bacterium]|nr:DUF1540 domain-containing protein [Candidatus Apopatousia equi]
MDLRCNKLSCKYNNKTTCKAKEIHVSEKTVCKTFERDKDKKQEKPSKVMFEQAPEFAPFRQKQNTDIKCNAKKCLFNKDGLCHANGITILDGKTDGVCGTFIEK